MKSMVLLALAVVGVVVAYFALRKKPTSPPTSEQAPAAAEQTPAAAEDIREQKWARSIASREPETKPFVATKLALNPYERVGIETDAKLNIIQHSKSVPAPIFHDVDIQKTAVPVGTSSRQFVGSQTFPGFLSMT